MNENASNAVTAALKNLITQGMKQLWGMLK